MELSRARKLCFFVVISLFSSPAIVGALTIPSKYDGFAFPPSRSSRVPPVVLEAFFDFTCPDCRSAWPTIKKLTELYGDDLALIIHPFPVPFHHNAFLAARAIHVVNGLNVSSTAPLMEHIFENQESFSNDATKDETPSSVLQRFVSLGVEAGASSRHQVYGGFLDTATDEATRFSFKYGCSRYVTATPTYLVNGVLSTADETWSVGRWQSVLEPLIAQRSAARDQARHDED